MCAQVAGEYGLTQEKWSRYSEFTNRGGNSLGESFKGCYQGAQDSEKRERGSAAKELGKVNKVVCVTKEILEKKKSYGQRWGIQKALRRTEPPVWPQGL